MANSCDNEEMEKDVEDLRKTIFEDQISYDVRASINEFSGDQRIVERYKTELQKLDATVKQNLLKNLVSCIPNTVNYDDRFLGMKCDGKISVQRANNLASLDLNQIGVKHSVVSDDFKCLGCFQSNRIYWCLD